MGTEEKGGSASSAHIKSFLTAFIILGVLMIIAYVLCFVLPAGQFEREILEGKEYVIPGTYQVTEGGIPFWKWLLSPLLVVAYDGGVMILLIIVFLLVVGGTFGALENSGILNHMLVKLANKYQSKRWFLLFLVSFILMLMGSFIGSFEECLPMIPIAVSLAVAMGWDDIVGLGMSLLAVGFGFASGIMNPFSVGIAQSLAEVPMFSGASLRIMAFVVIYIAMMTFLVLYGKKIERKRGTTTAAPMEAIKEDPNLDRGLKAFTTIIVIGLIALVIMGFVPALTDFILPMMALVFILSGLIAVPRAGISMKQYGSWFYHGMFGLAPAAALLLMASSIRYTLTEGGVMDTILNSAVNFIADKPQAVAILLIYLLVLLLNSVISSGSAKAFLLMPLIIPIVDMVGISRQLAILAFVFGDGFSNVFYPTNAGLLVGLSLADVSYGKWFRSTWPLMIVTLILTSLMLLFGLAIGYH